MKLFFQNHNNVGQFASSNSLERDVNPIINKHYSNLLPAAHAALAVFGTLALKNRTKPLSVMFEASSGYGKTAVLQMCFPPFTTENSSNQDKSLKMHMEKYVYRSDKFTPKAFVSYAANVKKEELEKIDLLPKLKNKVLVTKEMAPIFRGRETELKDNFSMLISVLDGKGLTTDSGMRGNRGYSGDIIFNWLGATTPLPASTHRMMSQLGTRLMFFELSFPEPTEEDLIAYAEKGDAGKAEVECNLAVAKFIVDFFKRNPVGSIDAESIVFTKELRHQLVKWAVFLVKARSEIKYDKESGDWEPISAMRPEAPYKVVNYLKELAIGHALIHDRKEIAQADMSLVAHTAISSVPGHLRPIIKELRKVDSVDAKKGEMICAVSRTTIRKYFKELELLGIVRLENGARQTNMSDTVSLAQDYLWLRD
jgi:hypothetical protein